MMEPRRTKVYGNDLRWRIVWQRKVNNRTIKDISSNLCVSPSTVWRILERFDRIGSVNATTRANNQAGSLHEHDIFIMIQLICSNPSIYLREIQIEMQSVTGTVVSASTICRALKKRGFTRKKLNLFALQRSNVLRAKYQAEISVYNTDMLIFLDETGCDRRNSLRKFGYSVRGKPARCAKLLSRGRRYSAIAIMSTSELIDCYIAADTVDGDVFYEFAQKSLLPILMPFNGINPASVVVMDNCSIHCLDDVVELIHSVGALVVYLPPYSPDFMPLEHCFSKIKYFLMEHEVMGQTESDIKLIIRAGFASVTQNDCHGWCRNCGYLHSGLFV